MPFLPLYDDYPRILIRHPWVTYAIVGACSFLFLVEISGGQRAYVEMIYGYGMIPVVLVGDGELPPDLYRIPALLTVLSSMFLHGDTMHLVGNMLYLWVFGDNIEDAMGHKRFAAFYAIGGTVAALAHVLSDPSSQVPTIGASGAVSAVLGGYLVLHPRAKVLTPVLWIPLMLPAWMLLGIWFGFQFWMAGSDPGLGGGVAWWAHIGGFVAGALLVVPFRHKAIRLWGGQAPPTGVRMTDRKHWRGRD
ncbi:MAG: rhomboid family intramembrane serine protease [Rhodovibrionaceae bacterium]